MAENREEHEKPRQRLRVTKNQHWKRGQRSKGISTSMKVRANAIILSVVLAAATALTINLAKIMLIDHDVYTTMANSRQFGSVVLPAARGSIYDANGTILAQSATVYKIFVDPKLFETEMKMVTDRNEELIAAAKKKKEEPASADVVDPETVKDVLVAYLAETLEMREEKVREAFADTTKQYVVLQKQVEKSRADRIIEFISAIHIPGSSRTINLSSVSRESDTKRYYPQNELAASVIGFTDGDGKGFYGVEKSYNDYLSGLNGKTITALDANGNEMPYRYSKTYPAQDGDDVHMTIDMTIQTYLETELNNLVQKYTPAKRACGVMLNAKTGAVMAMASVQGFDPNQPYEIYDPVLRAQVRALPAGEKRDAAMIEARETQWRNKCVTETYIPGSVFKVFTASAALEEKKVDYYADSFFCRGVINVAGIDIHCSNIYPGHQSQNFEAILRNSCNPAFIELGQRLGKQLFFQYFEAFGLTEKTGIDLPSETSSVYQHLETMGPVELAACSYGQTNSLSAIEMVTGYAAAVNGGYLLQPYVVSKITDKAGNVVLSNEKTVRRQVISESTSAQMRKALQSVVDYNNGSNAYIKGYKIGGKSGTSQKLVKGVQKGQEEYVASYCCFAPADDPEIVLLVMADEPNKSESYYGSTVAAPYARAVLEKTLPYLGYYPSSAEGDILDVTVPMLMDFSVAEAQKKLEERGLKCDIVGEGQLVNKQMPLTGTSIAQGGTVLLYTGTATEEEKVRVPYVVGMTPAEANEALSEAGLNYVAKGSGADNVKVLIQGIAAGSMVDKWSVVNLDFGVAADYG